jgi:hypothetical protein
MTEEITSRQTTEEANGAIPPGQPASTGGARHGAEKEINVYLYENLVSNLDCQIRAWIRRAERQSNYEMAQQFRWKAEGLGYALRLLYVFKADFDEITEEFGSRVPKVHHGGKHGNHTRQTHDARTVEVADCRHPTAMR